MLITFQNSDIWCCPLPPPPGSPAATPPSQLFAMFIGDTLGSLLMLYALAALLRLVRRAVEDE